jgi:N-acetylneuraminic acid mutarotase
MTRLLFFCCVVLSTILACKKVNEVSITVTYIYPDSDGLGASVQIYGKGFGNNAAKDALYFNGVKAMIDSCSDSVLVAVIPAGATTGPITITSPGHLTYRSPTNFGILTGTWIQKASFPGLPRANAATFSINNIGYVVSGVSENGTLLADMYAYDPTADSWTQKASLPAPGRQDAFGMTIGNKGYLIGGWDTTYGLSFLPDVWAYDPVADSWSRMNDFPGKPRVAAGGFSVGNIGYYGFGYFGTGDAMDWWRFDPAADAWTQKANFAYGTYNANYGFTLAGTGYLLSFDDQNWYSYDTAADQWIPGLALPSYVEPNGLSATAGSKGFFIEGAGRFHLTWVYDASRATWSRQTSFATQRVGSVSVGLNNTLYMGLGKYISRPSSPWPNDWWQFQP